MQFASHQVFQNFTQGRMPQPGYNICGKSAGQHGTGLTVAQPPGPQIKQLFIIKRAIGGTMGTLHVIGVDLQLRL